MSTQDLNLQRLVKRIRTYRNKARKKGFDTTKLDRMINAAYDASVQAKKREE